MDDFIKFIIFFSGTSFGGILGYLLRNQIEHRLAITRIYETARVTEFNKAVASFRAAFAPSLAFIYLAKNHGTTNKMPNVDDFLRKTVLDIATAVEVFRPFVLKSDGTYYQAAWEKYRYEVCIYGFDATTCRSDVDDPWKIFEDHIHKILQFADQK